MSRTNGCDLDGNKPGALGKDFGRDARNHPRDAGATVSFRRKLERSGFTALPRDFVKKNRRRGADVE